MNKFNIGDKVAIKNQNGTWIVGSIEDGLYNCYQKNDKGQLFKLSEECLSEPKKSLSQSTLSRLRLF